VIVPNVIGDRDRASSSAPTVARVVERCIWAAASPVASFARIAFKCASPGEIR
jgi:hypothetical protein